jgi:hypothetical protein
MFMNIESFWNIQAKRLTWITQVGTYRPDFLCHVLAFPFRFGAQTLAAFAH